VLFNEPKLLKFANGDGLDVSRCSFSALQRAEIAEIQDWHLAVLSGRIVSVLFNEPKLLKCWRGCLQKPRW